ncbi:MAG: glycosyltransferase [Gemmatimonadetes bacterium]|nr:glycosyltransferase [Gemmatimonadota bacterium]
MKILFLAPQPFFQVRGTCLATLRMLETLSRMGHTIDLLTFPGGAERSVDHVHARTVPNPFGIRRVPIGPSFAKAVLDLSLACSLFTSLVRRRCDVVHAGEEAAFIAALLCPLFRVPFLYDMDSHLTDQLRESGFVKNRFLLRVLVRWEKSVFRRASAVTVITPGFRELVNEIRGDDRVFLIEDIPIAQEWGDARSSRRTLRAREALADDPVVVYTGNLATYQGVALLVASIPVVLAKLPSARFAIIGGEERDVEDIRKRARAHGVEHAVILTGVLPLEVIAGELADADVLVSPRLTGENTPFKVYEYMAAGRPVVATDLPMHRPVLGEETAFLSPPDPASFGAAIVRALTDKDEAAARARRAKTKVESLYSIEQYEAKVSALYSSLAEDAGHERSSK